MIINRKIKRTMMESKAQYVGSLVLIIISCLLYTMFNQLTSNMVDSLSSFEESSVQEDASFIVDTKLTNIEEVEAKFGMLVEETRVIDYSVSDKKTLRVFSENTKVNRAAIIDGTGLNANNILIDPAYATANKLALGDTIKIYDKDYIVSGLMSLPNYIYPIKQESDMFNDPNSFGVAVISKNDFNDMNKGSSSYAIKFDENDKASVKLKIAEFKEYLKTENILVLKWTNVDENPRVTFVSIKIDGISKVSSTLPIFILLLTCILTGIVMWRLLQREFITIGTLYSMGYKKREIMKHYLSYPLTIALIGGIIGTILGFLAVNPMLNLMVTYFNFPIQAIRFNVLYGIISILLPVIFLIICGYYVVNKALKFSPLELMRGGRDNNKVNFIERRINLDKFKFSRKFKIRELMRSVPRSIFLLLGVMIATMLLLMGFAMKSSLNYLMEDSLVGTYKYQYQYMFQSLQQETASEGEEFSVSPFVLENDDKTGFVVYGINAATKYLSLNDRAGNSLSTDKIIITKPLADKLDLKAGGSIKVLNKLDSREYNITVDSIADTYVGEFIYMPIDVFNTMLEYPSDSYMGLWSKDSLNLDEDELLNTSTLGDYKAAFDTLTEPMQSYVGVIAFFAFIIGLIVIYVVTSLIIEENKESISLMKVFGYRKKEIYSLILNSSSFIVIIGYILGIPLLLISIRGLITSITESMNFAFPVMIDYSYIIIGFVIIYITYEVSKVLSRKKINRISMSEALKSGME